MEKQTITAGDVATISAEEIVRPKALVKLDATALGVLAAKAAEKFQEHLKVELDKLAGQSASLDDTIRIPLAFHVLVRASELVT